MQEDIPVLTVYGDGSGNVSSEARKEWPELLDVEEGERRRFQVREGDGCLELIPIKTAVQVDDSVDLESPR